MSANEIFNSYLVDNHVWDEMYEKKDVRQQYQGIFEFLSQLPPDVRKRFQQQFPDSAALRDLGAWHSFEQNNPLTFGNMYFFWVQKRQAS